jgi:hypothetical protein
VIRRTWPLVGRIGRRGVFLAMFGALYAAFGATLMTIPADRFGNPPPGFEALFEVGWWGIMWILCGVVACGVGFLRPRFRDDGPGFVALLIAPAMWSLLYAGAVALSLCTDGRYGTTRGTAGVVVWVLCWAVVLLVSGWPEEDRKPVGEAPAPPPVERGP